MKIFAAIFLIHCSVFNLFPVFSQSIVFEKYFSEGAFPARMVETPTGEYLICGRRLAPVTGEEQMHLSKFDKKGHLLWFKIYYDSAYQVIGRDVKLGEDGTYYLLATLLKSDYSESKVLLLHTDTAGNVLWSKTYYNNTFMDAWSMEISQMDAAKVAEIYITCRSGVQFSYSYWQGDILKLDIDGNVIWNNLYDLSGPNFFTDIKTLNDGGFIATGISDSYGVLLKGDKDGNVLWVKNFHAGNYIFPCSIVILPDQSIMGAGGLEFPTDLTWLDLLFPMVFKADTGGNIQWLKFIESEWKATWVQRMFKSWDNHFALGIFPQSIPFVNSGALVVKMDSVGNILSSKVYEKDLNLYYFQDLIQTRDSGLAGTSSISFSQYNNYAFFKTDKYGNTNCIDLELSYNFSDADVTYPFTFLTITQGITTDTFELSQKLIITEEFIICEDDSFVSLATGIPEVDEVLSNTFLYPNPMHDIAQVLVQNKMFHHITIEIYDLYGRKVKQHTHDFSQPMFFTRDGLSNGIYFYRIVVDKEDVIGKGKLVID